jgi:hypothetical protein
MTGKYGTTMNDWIDQRRDQEAAAREEARRWAADPVPPGWSTPTNVCKNFVNEGDWPRIAASAASAAQRRGGGVPFLGGGQVGVITSCNIPEDSVVQVSPNVIIMHPRRLLELSIALEPGLSHAQRCAAWSRIRMNVRLRGGLPSLAFILDYAHRCATLAEVTPAF